MNYIETMKQALEALVQCQQQLSSDWTHFTTATEAITNLRTAIDAAEKQEPVESCLCCGHVLTPKAWRADSPQIYVCERCHRRATACAPDRYATEQEGDAYTHGYFDGKGDLPAPTQPDSEQAKDAERLDWVIRNEVQVWEVNCRYSVREVTEGSAITTEHPTARDAIDAAMKVGAGGTAMKGKDE